MSDRRWMWGLLAAAALLWPARITGPFDGAPLDASAEAVLIGVVFSALWWFHPQFLSTRLTRGCVVALLVWKACTAATLVQDGFCVRFQPGQPIAKDETGAPHSWDLRADWRAADPACSAIMTRPYRELSEFPVWFFNLPPSTDSWPGPRDRPPGATTAMTVSGVLHAPAAGVLQILTGPDVAAVVRVDDGVAQEGATRDGVTLTRGRHRILVDATLTGDRWRFVPLWNGANLWADSARQVLAAWPAATVKRPSRLDLALRPWGQWVVASLVLTLLLAWLASAFARIRDANVVTWTIGVSCWIGLMVALGHDGVARWSIAGLMGAVLLRVPARLRNSFGAFLLIGVPWLTLIVSVSRPLIGHFTLYGSGNDYWMYQRYAYRIVMQGYWLEGGSRTFWFQPLYRWIVGPLHAVFGDSSVGEWYWDGACLLAMAFFAFHVAKRFAGFRWGIAAAVTTLSVVALGPAWGHIGLGLSEISSAGFAYLAALFALRSRHRNWRLAIAAGALATLAFYTRLNNLPMVLGIAALALPARRCIDAPFAEAPGRARVAWRTAAAIAGMLAAGVLLFACRTWYYTGVFSMFYGTQRASLSIWQPGMSLPAWLERSASSVMMVLTMHDPPDFDPMAIPLVLGFAVAVLAALRVPRLKELPAGLVWFCVAAASGSLVARGSAYSGRFSIHMIGVTSAVVTCAVALTLCRIRFTPSTSSSS